MKKIFYIDIDPSLENATGLSAIALVKRPAVEKDFLKFEKNEPVSQRFQTDECEHTIKGIAMLADTPIYRYNEEIGEHWVVFTKECIKKIMLKQAQEKSQSIVNLEHDSNRTVDQCFMIESYLIDREHGISPAEFEDVADGSWMVSFKVLDADLWDRIMKSEFKGFSIEGLFEYRGSKPKRNELDELIDEILS